MPAEKNTVELRIHASMRTIDEATWNGLLGADGPPFLTWAFLDTLERTGCVGRGTGWMPHHVTFSQDGRIVGAAPAYLKGNSEGEFVFDFSWANLARRLGLDYYPKLLFAVPFTPATGPRLLCSAEDRPLLLRVFAGAVRRLVESRDVSSAHVLFPPAEDAEILSGAGLAHRYGVQFQWRNQGYRTYDDFLARFNAKRRHVIRRERRELARQGVTIKTHTGASLTPAVVDAMYGFYLRTIQKFSWGRQYLNRAFFEEVCSRLPGKIEVVLATDGGRPIAGAFNLAGGGVLYGRYWGASEERPFLHFNVCYYHSVDECIERGFSRFEPGAGGEHKMARGFDPTITHSVHHLADPQFDAIVREYLGREREAVRESVAGGGEAAERDG